MDTIRENNLLTSSDYEHIIEDLQSDNAFQLVDQEFEPVPKNNDSIVRVQGPPILENYSHLQTRGEIIDNEMHGQGDPPHTLESYMIEEHHDVKHVQNSIPLEIPLPSFSPTGTIPCRDNYPGPLNFELLLDASSSHRRSWVYSNKLKKVFIDINKSLLVQFQIANHINGLSVRALPVYSMDDYVSTPVQRCDLHILSEDVLHKAHSKDPPMCFCANFQWVRHVVKSNHSQAIYEYDCDSDRHSVRVPLEVPQAGSDTVEVEYHFTCKTSCPRGMSRKPINVIFTLETEQREVLGRYVLPVKICSCPKRDKEKEEATEPQDGSLKPGPTKRRISSASEKQEESKKIKIEHITPKKDHQLEQPPPIQEADNNQNPVIMNGVLNEEIMGKILVNVTSQISELKNEVLQQREEILQFRNDVTNRIEPMLKAIYHLLRQDQI